jgi:hypothetical protein
MKHSIGYLGRFERSFASLRPGVREYVRENGSVGQAHERPKDVDGLFFGYMECDGKRYVAVRVQYAGDDVTFSNPVPLDPPRHTDGKRFGPNPSRFGDDSAERLLIDLIAANPAQAPELMRMARAIGFRTSEAG